VARSAVALAVLATLLAALGVAVALTIPASLAWSLPMPGGGGTPIPEALLLVSPLFALVSLALARRAGPSEGAAAPAITGGLCVSAVIVTGAVVIVVMAIAA
jgi:hypothetical protein